MQVLLGSDGRGGDPLALDRVQVAALVATAAKFGSACETVERFRELDLEEEAKVAWLAGRAAPAWGPRDPQAAAAAAPVATGAAVLAAASSASPPVASPCTLSEDEAKRAWLAKRVPPAWGCDR